MGRRRVRVSCWCVRLVLKSLQFAKVIRIFEHTDPPDPPEMVATSNWNIPNAITSARLVVAVLFFALIPMGMVWPALITFLLAAGTDWLDGYWARKFNQITQLGRILDPFADKFIISGAFIFLVAEPNSGIHAWMAVLVIAREMLVTTIRSMMEQQGVDFSAVFAGKLKMVLQCVAVVLSLLGLQYLVDGSPSWLRWSRDISIWLAIVSTIYSGAGYVLRSTRLVRG